MKALVYVLCAVGIGILFAAVHGCGSPQINQTIDQALLYETSWQNDFTSLATVADDMIPLLPADQQQAKRDILSKIRVAGNEAFQAKEDALQAAKAANQKTFDVTQFAVQIAAAIEQVLALCTELKAPAEALQGPTTRLVRLRADINRGALKLSATP